MKYEVKGERDEGGREGGRMYRKDGEKAATGGG